MDGLAHVRVYEERGQIPVVIVGQLDDNPGTHLTVGIEVAAAAIHDNLFRDGREFRLVSYEPRDMLGNSWFRVIEFQHPAVDEDRDHSHYASAIVFVSDAGEQLAPATRTPKKGDFRDPVWHHLDDPAELVGCEVQTWARGEYTALVVFGPEGEAVRTKFAANTRAIGDQLQAYFEE